MTKLPPPPHCKLCLRPCVDRNYVTLVYNNCGLFILHIDHNKGLHTPKGEEGM